MIHNLFYSENSLSQAFIYQSMMNALDSPLDALVFDYVSFGIFTFVNNIWTCLAVITAAVSFWRIRAGGASISCAVKVESESIPAPASCIDRSTSDNQPRPVSETSVSDTPSPVVSTSSNDYTPSIFVENGVTKGKFLAYYEDDRDNYCKGQGDDESTEVGEWGYCGGCGEWWESWEKVLKAKLGEMEWYRYQDLTAINGNVVRLWDGVRTEKYSIVW